METNEATESVSFAGEGTIVADNTIESYYNKVKCVYYHSILEKLTGSGKNRKWEVVRNVTEAIPFYLEDDRGRLRIDVRNMDEDSSGHKITYDNKDKKDHKYSEIDTVAVLSKKSFKEKRVKYRKSEYVLEPNTKGFVYGYVEEDKEGLVLREHQDHPLIISRKTHQAFKKEFSKGKNIIYFVHVLVFIGFSITLLALSSYKFAPYELFIALIGVGAIIIFGSVIFTMYNRIVLLRNRLFNTWSNIDTELKRRHNLIPRLVASVKGMASHEKNVQSIVTALRSGEQTDASQAKTHKTVLATLEKYPDIKANESFQKLMIELVDTEERIAYSRDFYNTAVRSYNTVIEQFPSNVLAGMFKFTSYGFIQISDAEKNVPSATVS